MGNDFINKINLLIEESIADENFGVSELADRIGMSRSNLLRRIRKETNLSASQFIRQVRLQHAKEMLKDSSFNVSEVAFKVGFSSTSYFIKCFREHYGFSPGEMDKMMNDEVSEIDELDEKETRKSKGILPLVIIAVFCLLIILSLIRLFMPGPQLKEKSIAVLPFINDSQDSANVYIINGLMESVLDNLQKIEDLRVVSRTSVEKYRANLKSVPEIGDELSVRYIVEGSGQKIGDRIKLHIQLIEAVSDKHLWSRQYQREAKDIFSLQQEVAMDIAQEIEAIITPEEEDRIEHVYTKNLEAYDYFMKGMDLMYSYSYEGLLGAITMFRSAWNEDPQYARAYAATAISYYYLDVYQADRIYADSINKYADQALLLDPQLAQALIAKALFYMHSGAYDLAVPYLEKALEYNPNSALVINRLSDFYASYVPDTEKYLEYALKGIRLDIASHDSSTASMIYLHLSNAFIQSGFVDEAIHYIERSLAYDPANIFSQYVKAFILYAQHGDLAKTKEMLLITLKADTTRLDVLQEVGKICYYMRDYESAYFFYSKFVEARETYDLDIFQYEDAKIALVYGKVGQEQKSLELLESYRQYAERSNSVYKHLSFSVYYAYSGNTKKALEHLKIFSGEDNFHYWTILFLEIDPLVDNIKHLPEFKDIMNDLKSNFYEYHDDIRNTLEEKDLI